MKLLELQRRTDQPEVKVSEILFAELLSFDDEPQPIPLWLEVRPLPNIWRDNLVQKIKDLDDDYDKYISSRRSRYNKCKYKEKP